MTNTELAMEMIKKHCKEEIRSFFTSEEWDAINSAMADFADYGEEEAETSDSIQSKIYQLFAS